MCPVSKDCSHSSCRTVIGCQAEKDHPLQPGINKQAQQLKCHHLLCNAGCVHVRLCANETKDVSMHVHACVCDFVCVFDATLRFLCRRLHLN